MTTGATNLRSPGGLVAAAVSVGLALAVGALGGFATASSVNTWYVGLNKPAFTPPPQVFPVVWTTLYVVMGVAAWRVWCAPGTDGRRRAALALYGLQLALNLAWSFLFFGLRQPGVALVEVVVLLAAILATAAAFWRLDRPAALLMAPYAAWVAYAAALNFEVWRLNS